MLPTSAPATAAESEKVSVSKTVDRLVSVTEAESEKVSAAKTAGWWASTTAVETAKVSAAKTVVASGWARVHLWGVGTAALSAAGTVAPREVAWVGRWGGEWGSRW